MPASGLIVPLKGAVAGAFEAMEVVDAGRAQQALVEERLRRRQDHVSVDIVLQVLVGLIADPAPGPSRDSPAKT